MADNFKKFEDEVLEKEVRHDEEKINEKKNDIAEHEEQISKDKSKFMKDVHGEEIKHDEHVIFDKEREAGKHEAKIKANEEKINK